MTKIKQRPRLLTFGEVLTVLRVKQKLSAGDLAELMGWSPTHVRMIEEGVETVSNREAIALAHALEVDPKLLTVVVPSET